MRRFPLFLLVLWSIVTASAQNGAVDWPPPAAAEQERILRIQRELHLWLLQERDSPVAKQLAEQRADQYRQREFEERTNRFVAIWNKLVGEYNERRAFNVKDARAASKAFRELEATGWPK